jgi:hypothetical protein
MAKAPSKELLEMAEMLQKLFRVADWNVLVQLVDKNEIFRIMKGTEDCYEGYCGMNDLALEASIGILDESEDYNYTLIHEILHIVLADLEQPFLSALELHPNDALEAEFRRELERTIARLTDGIYALLFEGKIEEGGENGKKDKKQPRKPKESK